MRAQAYGAQAVVVSIDPRRVWVADPADTPRPTVATANFGPHGEAYCWWQARSRAQRACNYSSHPRPKW